MINAERSTMIEAIQPSQYDTFLWLELIGFDNRQADMGVRAYLDGLGFIPTGLSIFMWGPDFVHLHDGLSENAEFPPDIGAYLDCFYFEKKQPGPPWTKYQLKKLIDELHRYGIEVHFSIFPNSLDNRFHREWISDHPEVGVTYLVEVDPWFPMVHPLKRLCDGSYYEDFFVKKISEVVSDYGFDGIHLVDGYNHGWYQLWDAEFSDDMVEQFIAHSGISLPDACSLRCGESKPDLKKRAEWIWTHQRMAWINFHVERWDVYFRKITTALHALGKKVACNTCWTRDPMESIYRYGIDLRRLASAGVDRFVVETCGAGGELLNKVCRARFSAPFFHVIKATSLLTRAYLPEANIVFNNCTQDITEGWSVIRHAPAFLEREIYSYANLYHYDANAQPLRVFDGLNVCLAAGMEPQEWRWVKERWESAFSLQPDRIDGLTLVWSSDAMKAEIDYYCQTRNSLTQNILYHLLAKGVPVCSTVDVHDIASVDGPLLVINPHLFTREQADVLAKRASSAVVTIGLAGLNGLKANAQIIDHSGDGAMRICIYGSSADAASAQSMLTEPPVRLDPRMATEPPSFFDEMIFQPVSDAFYEACAQAIQKAIAMPLRLDIEGFSHGEWAGVQTFRKPGGGHRCFIWNDKYQYVDARFTADRVLQRIDMVSKFRGRPIVPFDGEQDPMKPGTGCGRQFIARIPPKGIGVVDIVPDIS